MSVHPYFAEQLVADRRRELMQQASDHRLGRQATTPTAATAFVHPTSEPRPQRLKVLAILRRLRTAAS
jgi:hypothetical protein